jgi:hypothetical protein
MATQAGLAQQAVNAGAAQRAQEQQAALSQYGQLAGQQRSQDLQGDTNTLQQAQANAQLAQQQQLANQGMSSNILGGVAGLAMKAAPALAMMSDANAKTELSYGDMPVGTSYLQEPGGPHDGHTPASFAFREESAGPGHEGFVALIDHQSGRIGKVPQVPLTRSEAAQVMAPHGAGPIGRHGDMALGVAGVAPAMKQRYGDMPVGEPDHQPIGNVSTYQNADGTWGRDEPQSSSGPAPMGMANAKNPADEASDASLRAMTAPGGFAGGYRPDRGSLTFSGPSEAADAQKPVSWLDKPPPEGISSDAALQKLGFSLGVGGALGSSDKGPRSTWGAADYGMKPPSPGIARFTGQEDPSANQTFDELAQSHAGQGGTVNQAALDDRMTSDAGAKDEAHYQGYLRGIKEATAPDSIAKVSHLAPYMDAGRPGDSFVMSPHGYVPAEPPQPTQPLLAPYKPASGDQPAQVLSPTGYVRADPPPPPQEGPVRYADRIYNDEPIGPQPSAPAQDYRGMQIPAGQEGGWSTGAPAPETNPIQAGFGAAVDKMDAAQKSYANWRNAASVADRQIAQDQRAQPSLLKTVGNSHASNAEKPSGFASASGTAFKDASGTGYYVPNGGHRALEMLAGPTGVVPAEGQFRGIVRPTAEPDAVTSDARAKQMEASHPGFAAASQFMDALEPHAYTWRDKSVAPNSGAANSPNIGVFAQDVEKTPFGASIVQRDPHTGYRTMDKSALLGALAASVGATKKLSDDHAMRIEQLERAMGTRR